MAAAGNYNGDYPLKDIAQPHPHDVLCGRGGGTNNHIGNSHWRMLVAANKQLYITLPKRQKMLLSRSIVNAVRSQNPPGRFLQKDSKSNKWFDVGDQRAQEKTSQALREGAPDIRKKVAADKGSDVDTTDDATENPGDESTGSNEKSEGPLETSSDSAANNSNQAATAAAPQSAQAMAAQHHQPMMHQQHQPYMGHVPQGMPMHAYHPGMHAYPQQIYPGHQMAYPHMGMHIPQGYPPMVMNEHGMMVPATYMPHHMMPSQQYMPHGGMQPPQTAQNHHYRGQPQHDDDSEPIPYTPSADSSNQNGQYHSDRTNGKSAPDFDDIVAAVPPPDGGLEPAVLSFGSVMMTDSDMKKLEGGGVSFGTALAGVRRENFPEPTAHFDSAPGASFGDVSMMSVGTRKLEGAGFSFGSAMSYNTVRADMPDGGLEDIGTSFGSLSLDTNNRETLFQQLELAAAGPEIPPMLNSTKSKGNLLGDIDSDDEDEDESQRHDIQRKKSEAWERMQASVANHISSQKSKSTVGSSELMPPPPSVPTDKTGTDISVPTTSFERDFSQLSAFDDDFRNDGRDDTMPPPSLQKQTDDDEKLEMYLIQQRTEL